MTKQDKLDLQLSNEEEHVGGSSQDHARELSKIVNIHDALWTLPLTKFLLVSNEGDHILSLRDD